MSSFQSNYKNLNKYQKEAVDSIEGPVMVIAGPGTGKTQILGLRIANILQQTDATAENILCITFTEAGVTAMRERLTRFIGSDAYKVTISTFHGFANEVIQSHPEKFAFSKKLKQLDDLTRIKILQEIIDSSENLKKLKPFYDKYAKINDVINALGILKKEGISPDQLESKLVKIIDYKKDNPKLRNGEPTKTWQKELEKLEDLHELVYIYRQYQQKLTDEGFYDYEDMIMFVVDKFQTDLDLLSHYQLQYLYIHVDEYQDTNGAQNKIIELLGKNEDHNSPNIFVVGDDDQAIYRFQGASLGNILFFTNHFSNVKTVVTPVSYRSTQTILNIADSLIQKNNFRLVNQSKDLEKTLQSFSNEVGSKGEVHEFSNEDAENIFIAKKVQELHESGVSYKDIAIIYRKNYHSENINNALEKFGIPTKLDSSKSVFESSAVAQLLKMLLVIQLFDKNLDENFYKVMQYEFLNLDTVGVWKIANRAYKEKKSIFEALSELSENALTTKTKLDDEAESLSPDLKLIQFYTKFINWHKTSLNMKFSQFLEFLLEDSGLLEFYLQNELTVDKESSNNFNDVLAINSFYKYVLQQEEIDSEVSMKSFLTNLELVRENNIKISLPKVDSGKDAVNLLTAHGSKGLEYKYVFIIKCTDNNWGKVRKTPSLLPEEVYSFDLEDISDKDLSLEDERRLFFVAITRAKEQVYFTYAKEYSQQGSISTPSISQFINEIDLDLLKLNSAEEESNLEIEDIGKLLLPKQQKNYSDEEKEFLLNEISKFKLSASSLNSYIKSPLQFKINNLIKVPKAKQKHAALGTAIHYSTEKFNRALIKIASENGLETISPTEVPSIEFVLMQFEESLKNEFFGYEDFDATLEEGKLIITNYYNNYLANTELIKPVEVEYNFYNNNIYFDPSKDGFESIDQIAISGRLDKLEWIDLENNEVKVVDYKTGSDKTRNQILGDTKNADKSLWRQLVFYKLLGDLDSKFRPNRSLNHPKYKITHAELDFMKVNKVSGKFRKEIFEIKDSDVRELKEVIVEVMKRIRNLEFPEVSGIE